MDIEGGELEALKGLTKTIAILKPILVIAVYHRPEDLIKIPLTILEANHDYIFFLKHNSEDYIETVMFGLPLPPHTEIESVVLLDDLEELIKLYAIFKARVRAF